jgi:hypothetical protein
MVSGFRIIFSDVPNWSSYELTVTWSTTTESPIALQVVSPESYFDSSDAFHVRGMIKNNSSSQRTFVQIFLTMYDASNTVIGVDSSYTSPTTLEPGQSVPFDIYAFFWKFKPNRAKVAQYSIRAFDD